MTKGYILPASPRQAAEVKTPLRNLYVGPKTGTFNGDRIAMGWDDGTHRYLVWCALDDDDRLTPDSILYKNSIAERGEPGHDDTRHVDATSQRWAPTIAVALGLVHKGAMMAAWRAEQRLEEERKRLELEAWERAQRIAEEG